MTVSFPSVTANQKYVPSVTVANSLQQPATTKEVIKADTLEKSTDKKEKQSLFSKIGSFWGGVKKAFASAGEYTKGFVKGIASGAVAGSLVYTVTSIMKASKKQTKNTAGKALAVVAAVGAFVYNMYQAYLNSNEAKANIDHRYR